MCGCIYIDRYIHIYKHEHTYIYNLTQSTHTHTHTNTTPLFKQMHSITLSQHCISWQALYVCMHSLIKYTYFMASTVCMNSYVLSMHT